MNVVRIQTWRPAVVAAAVLALTAAAPAADEAMRKQIQQLNTISGTDQVNAKVQELVKDTKGTEKLLAAAEELLKTSAKDFKYNSAVILGRAAVGLKKYEQSLTFFKHCRTLALQLQSPNKLIEAFESQYSVLYELKKYEEAEKLCQEFLETTVNDELERSKPFVMEQMIQAKTKQGKIQEALKMTEALVKLDEGGWYFLRLKGWVLQQDEKLAEAAAAYHEALERLAKADKPEGAEKKRWLDRTRYVLSSVYVDMGQIDKAADQLKALLKEHPDHPTYNNDLGYIWADHDKNLDEAEKLIRKAIDEDRKQRAKLKVPKEEDTDKAAYLDSLGWVLFKKKNYAEAKKWLLEATKDQEEGQHIEILDHLADVHLALGEKKEAVAIWKKCLEFDPTTKREIKKRDEVEKKLKAAEKK